MTYNLIDMEMGTIIADDIVTHNTGVVGGGGLGAGVEPPPNKSKYCCCVYLLCKVGLDRYVSIKFCVVAISNKFSLFLAMHYLFHRLGE